jgi:outer membrane immunogenic protein
LVIGVEADASFGRIRGEDAKPFFVNTNDNGDNGAVFNGLAHLRQSVDDFGTVRGRLGFAADTLLVYATGGGAWAHTKTNFSVDHIVLLDPGDLTAAQVAPLLAGGNVSSNALRYGYSVGGGAEWAFARHWSIKAEYLYLSFTGRGATLVIPGGVAHAGNFEMHTAKGGINYRF